MINIVKNNSLIVSIIIITGVVTSVLMAAPSEKVATAPTTETLATSAPSPSEGTVDSSFLLVLNDDEQKIVSEALNHGKNQNDDNTTCYYLGGIIYSAPTNWTLWLNGQTYSPGTEIPGITISNVSRDGVNIKDNDAKAKNSIWLKMDQTFCRDTGQTLPGDQRR